MKATARALRDERIARAYDGSLRTTAKLFGLSHEGVRKILIAQGVEIAPACTWNHRETNHGGYRAKYDPDSDSVKSARRPNSICGFPFPNSTITTCSEPSETGATDFIDSFSHRSPPRLRISAGTLSGVETVPAASPSQAAGTTYSVR